MRRVVTLRRAVAGCAGVRTMWRIGGDAAGGTVPAGASPRVLAEPEWHQGKTSWTMSPKRRCNHLSRRNHRHPSARARADRRVRRSARRRTGPATRAARAHNPELVKRMAVWVVRSGRARHAPRSCSPARCGTCGPSSPETSQAAVSGRSSCRTCGTTGRARQIAAVAPSVRPLQNRSATCNVPTKKVACAQ